MISSLLVEHDQLIKTLNLLEMQYLDMCRGGIPDYSLMKSILEYVRDYPDQVHHPVENLIFTILLERVDEADLIQAVIDEHSELEKLTRKISESIKLLLARRVSSDEVKKQLSEFLIKQRQHIYVEEEHIYPLVEKHFTNDDWSYVKSKVPLYTNLSSNV